MILTQEIKTFFKKIPSLAFATVDSNSNPNVVAIANWRCIWDDTIQIIDFFLNKTKSNILQNQKVAFSAWTSSEWYQMKGTAHYHTHWNFFDEWKTRISPSHPEKIVKGVIEVKITELYSITPTYETAGKGIG